MRSRSRPIVAACAWRSGTSRCVRRLFAQVRDPEGGAPNKPTIFDCLPGTAEFDEIANCLPKNGLPCRYFPRTPHYDAQRRELWVGQLMVRCYARQAWNQIAVLEMFELHGWPPEIENPLGKKFDARYVARLKKTVFQLNRGQWPWLIHFRGHEIIRAIGWEFRIPLKGT